MINGRGKGETILGLTKQKTFSNLTPYKLRLELKPHSGNHVFVHTAVYWGKGCLGPGLEEMEYRCRPPQ